ncbi:MAG: hypothetical protein P4M11_15910 [Candidatus Pacebacteria bacterium]|nr:hypothetical protein [Candidatus Paceibacterota bacterium]
MKLLLEYRANPYVLSITGENEEESLLETACRWNHLAIIRLYVEKFKWGLGTLRRAWGYCRPGEVRDTIRRLIVATMKEYACACMCFLCCRRPAEQVTPESR